MRASVFPAAAVIAAWALCAAAMDAARAFDSAAIAGVVADLSARLPASMSVTRRGHLVIAAPASGQDPGEQHQRVARFEAGMRQRAFPELDARRLIVVLAADGSALRGLSTTLYPQLSTSDVPDSGFYHRRDRLILVSSANGYTDLAAQLMRALVRDDNPQAPQWFEEAAATLYESSEWRGARLAPTLDGRMRDIAADQDLAYDVFAGVCDCYPLSAEQLALMRLLLVFLERRDELRLLRAAVKEQGRYTTLLQALDAMAFDRDAWKAFAEHSVRAYPR